MGKFDAALGSTDSGKQTPNPSPAAEPNNSAAAPAPTQAQIDADTYSDEELSDVNAIVTVIPDTTTPVAVFFGPASSGKTMTLLRMIRYFQDDLGYTVEAETNFRPSHDRHYTKMCRNLPTMVNDIYAPSGNDVISFMLVKIYDKGGRAVMQILEAPGEHYFSPENPQEPFPAYIEKIIQTIPNRKIWVYFAEQDWKDQGDRNNYAAKIRQMQVRTPRDKVVFLFNKSDKKSVQYDRNGKPKADLFINAISQQYPGIFTAYANSGIARVLFGPYRFSPVCFSSGTFSNTASGRQQWNVGPRFYCDALWKALGGH